MPSDLLIPFFGGSAIQIASAIQNGVFAKLLLDAQHSLLNFALPLQLSHFLLQPLLLYLDIIEQVKLHRGFRLLLCRIFTHQPIGGDGKSPNRQLRIDLCIINAKNGVRDAPGRRCFSRQVCCSVGVLGDLSAIAVCHGLAVVAAASGVFNVISHRQGQLIRYQLLFQQIQRDGFRHLPYNQPCFLKGIRALENLPGADAVRFRPVCLDILHTARLPAPCVVDEEFSVDAEHPIEQFFIVVFVRLADGAFCNVAHGVDTDGLELFGVSRLVVREMAEAVAMDLLEKRLVTDQLTLTVGYDIENTAGGNFRGEIVTDRYGRKIPKHAHGTANLPRKTSSARSIMDAVLSIYDEKVNPKLSVRRITITANRLVGEDTAQQESEAPVQFNLFDDIAAQEQQHKDEETKLERERKIQEAMLGIKKKFGKNAILNGGSYLDGATARERNGQIGGHKA